jgi:hypothetical protein
LKRAVDALSPEELAKLAAYIAHHDKLAWDEQLEHHFFLEGNTRKRSRKSMPKLTQAPSRRCREVTRVAVFLEVLSPASTTRSKHARVVLTDRLLPVR